MVLKQKAAMQARKPGMVAQDRTQCKTVSAIFYPNYLQVLACTPTVNTPQNTGKMTH
jgi:hypothetical protein